MGVCGRFCRAECCAAAAAAAAATACSNVVNFATQETQLLHTHFVKEESNFTGRSVGISPSFQLAAPAHGILCLGK